MHKEKWGLNFMQCKDGPDHGRSSSRHFAFQMKAKLKLRHGLLNI